MIRYRPHLEGSAARFEPLWALAASSLIILGLLWPSCSAAFYPGLLAASFLIVARPCSRWTAYAFVAPYFLLLGLAVWQPVFPWITGLLLALLLGELAGRLLYLLLRQAGHLRLLVLPCAWFCFYYAFARIPGFNRMQMIPLLAPVALRTEALALCAAWGPSLVLFFLAAIAGALILLVLRAAGCRVGDQRTVVLAGALLAAGCLALGIGLAGYRAVPSSGRTVRIAVARGVPSRGSSVQTAEELAQYHQTRRDAYLALDWPADADIYVLPETELGLWDRQNRIDQAYRDAYLSLARQLGGLTVLCVTEGDSVSQTDRHFSALLLDDTRFYGLSAKRFLVPFSESDRYTPGTRFDVYDTPAGKVGLAICYDFQGPTAGKLKANGAELLLAPFNDSGFGRVYQHLHRTSVVMQAAQLALPVAMANEGGIAQIVDGRGRILAERNGPGTGVIDETLMLDSRQSLYLLFGRWAALAFAIASSGWLFFLFASGMVCFFRQRTIRKLAGRKDRVD
ncbi:MAG: carbon-nitrogen hydrolase family protein [Clostridiaceae bacterium]|nr:carbon-nitrogen hydrolase family protein [Clostridiaceae bacterium]